MGNLLTRSQLNGQIAALSRGVAPTNFQAKRIGLNLPSPAGYEHSRVYVDLMRRNGGAWKVAGQDPVSGTPVALKSNKTPSASYNAVYTYNPVTVDLGTYSCWMNGTCASVVGTGCSISAFTYDAINDKTTFTLTISQTTTEMYITVNTPSLTADNIRIIQNGLGFDPVANANDFHPDFLSQLAISTGLRGMDWLYTNSSTDTNWATSVASGGDGTIRSASSSLSEMIRLANLGPYDIHVNAPPQATDDWLTNASALISTNLNSGVVCQCEFSNEPWNGSLGNMQSTMIPALALGGSFTGFSGNASQQLISAVRTSNVVTITLSGPPATSGPFYIGGIIGITGGYVDSSKSIVVSGNTFTYNEIGSNVTGTLQPSTHNAYIHTNLAHYIVKATISVGTPSLNGVTPYIMNYRYVIERTRSWYTIVQALSDKARYRFILNGQVGVQDFALRAYAVDRWSDDSWISEIQMAPYIEPTLSSSTSSADQIISAMQTILATYPKTFVQQSNAARSFRPVGSTAIRGIGYYEGGPGTPNVNYPPNTAIVAAAVGAANRDDRMRSLILKPLYQAMRDAGQTGTFFYFAAGASTGFDSTTNNSTWDLSEYTPADLSGPKARSLIEFGADTSISQPSSGLTTGTINFVDVYTNTFGFSDSNGCRIVGTTANVGDIVIVLVKAVAGTYPVSVWISQTSTTDTASIWINDVQQATNAVLTNVSGFTPPSSAFWTANVHLAAGINELRIRVKAATRAGFVNLYQVQAP
jgi:hypothetical protein